MGESNTNILVLTERQSDSLLSVSSSRERRRLSPRDCGQAEFGSAPAKKTNCDAVPRFGTLLLEINYSFLCV